METCYNKGCGQKFSIEENNQTSCTYHPGVPVFHDAKKKWSCCNKYSTDFSEFLSIKGCTTGQHSNEKPVVEAIEPKVIDQPVYESPKPAVEIKERPSNTEPLSKLKCSIMSSLQNLLDNNNSKLIGDVKKLAVDDEIQKGMKCKNNGCSTVFEGSASDAQVCQYHPGAPVFHEGSKYWSCCQRKTSDFEAFMNQAGCATGRHSWRKSASEEKKPNSCRHDWFQLPDCITLNIYAKTVLPETVVIECNQVHLKVSFKYDMGELNFSKEFNLFGIVDPEKSEVKLLGTKVEICLHKGQAMSWTNLELKAV